MQSQQPIELLAAHASLWKRLQSMLDKKRYPQALLFVGPRHAGMLQLANRFMAALICKHIAAPCGHCSACYLLTQGIHPDIHYVGQALPDKAIKIDQIRDLQQDVYQTPQRGAYRFIIIDPADKMNVPAANALLKILEEPPAHTVFILLAEQIGSLPATILSRCQHYVFEPAEHSDYLLLGQLYLADTARAQLFEQAMPILETLNDLMEERASPCMVASLWAAFALEDILWFLYLITAQIIHHQLIACSDNSKPWNKQLSHLSRLIKPPQLFHQLDEITTLMRKMHHNINSNQTLALENLLLGYLSTSHD